MEPLVLTGVVISAASAAASAIASGYAKSRANAPPRKLAESNDDETEDAVRLPELREREREATWALRVYSFAANVATFGQLVIGGLLASQFVQQEMGRTWIGLMGAITLASTILQRHYQFGARAAAASSDAFELKRLIRQLEDDLMALPKDGEERRRALLVLRRKGSEQLNNVDRPDTRPVTPPPRRHAPDNELARRAKSAR